MYAGGDTIIDEVNGTVTTEYSFGDGVGGAGNAMSLINGGINAAASIICSGLAYGTKMLQMEDATKQAEHVRDLKFGEIRSKEETLKTVEVIAQRNMKQAEKLAKLEARDHVLTAQITSQERIAEESHINVKALKTEFSIIRDMRSEYHTGNPCRTF